MAVRGCFRADANSCCELLPEQEDRADINNIIHATKTYNAPRVEPFVNEVGALRSPFH